MGNEREEALAVEWRAMQRRIVEHLGDPRSTDLAAAPHHVPAALYTDPERFEAERRHVFGELPLLAGFSCDLPEPGDRMLFDEAGPPILIVRDMQGEIRAFLNLCPHRGGRLVETCERGRRLVCPFHAWSFTLDGKLATVAHPPSFEGLDFESHSLVPLPAEEWKGMIFVGATPGGSIDVETFLGPLAKVADALEFEKLERVCLDRFEVEANWKIALDTFCENYHVPSLHKESLSLNLIPYVTLFDHYGRHHRYSGPGLDFHDFAGRPESEWPESAYQAVHYLFPNATLAYTHSFDGKTPVVSMFRHFPGKTIGETVTLGSTYRRSDAPDPSDERIAEMHGIVLDIVQNEDYRIARDTWKNLLHAPPDFRVVFGRSEALLQRVHEDLAEQVGMPILD